MNEDLISNLAELLGQRGEWLATAESCTGGLIAKQITDRAGSSTWFERGLVTYSNLAKVELLNVDEALIARYGAVSEACAAAMVRGLLRACPVDWGLAVTGIAGPGGGTPDKPVGTVWIAWIHRGSAPDAKRFFLEGDRGSIREQAAQVALEGLLYRIQESA